MKHIATLLILLLTTIVAGAQDEQFFSPTDSTESISLPWPRNLQSRIDSIVTDPLTEVSQLGLMIWDLTADSAIYRYNERQLMRPASTMKLLTAVTALRQLGVNYQFSTSFYYRGEMDGDTLVGNIYCVGGMDPMLDGSDLHSVCNALRERGIMAIKGCLVADLSMKDTLRWGEGWCWDDENPTLSPLTLGRNTQFTRALAEKMAELGMTTDSIMIGEGPTPSDALLFCVRHHTIDQVLQKMMKDSDNFYAESMLYQIAASTGARNASAKDAQKIERKLINAIGLNASDYRLADGSGLSLYNYVTAELLTRLLRYAYRHDDIYIHLQPSLPIAGQDGTLAKRMRTSAAEGNVRAKTGTLTGIVSLTGYCTAANGHQLCFTIINQGIRQARDGRRLQDRICNAMCE